MSARILVVEDEAPVRDMIRFLLSQEGMDVLEAEDSGAAERQIAANQPNLILLDWMLPGTSGVDFARDLKRSPETNAIPIIMLTARTEDDDKVKGFESGVDDYVTKPFSAGELLARIRAVLRRVSPHHTDEKLEVDGLELDPASHRVTVQGASVKLGPTEFRLLHFFMAHQERVYSRSQILDQVWGLNVYVEERTVDVHIRRLRKALGERNCDKYLQTVRGSGYRFSARS